MRFNAKFGVVLRWQIFTRQEGDSALRTHFRHSSEVLIGFGGGLNFGSEIGLVGQLRKGFKVPSFLDRQREGEIEDACEA